MSPSTASLAIGHPALNGLVSVVVPVYNGGLTIEPCIRSLLELDYPREQVEIVVVDNGSVDDTRAVLARYQHRIRILAEARRGPSAARNTGVRAARGEVIAFTDADCVVDREWLHSLLRPLQDPEVGITGGAIHATRPCNRIERFGEAIHDHRRAIEEFVPPYAITMNWAARRAVLLESGLFDENLFRGEDVDLAYRIHAAGYRLVFCPDALVYHRNESTLSGLFREGMDHGNAMVMVKTKTMHSAEARRRFPLRFQVLRAARQAFLGDLSGSGDRVDAFCDLVFSLGKAMGAAATRRRLRRTGRQPASAD